jgi:hypothetical protein
MYVRKEAVLSSQIEGTQLCGRQRACRAPGDHIGVLREMTGRSRNRRFRYDAYIRLFDEPGVDSEGAGA